MRVWGIVVLAMTMSEVAFAAESDKCRDVGIVGEMPKGFPLGVSINEVKGRIFPAPGCDRKVDSCEYMDRLGYRYYFLEDGLTTDEPFADGPLIMKAANAEDGAPLPFGLTWKDGRAEVLRKLRARSGKPKLDGRLDFSVIGCWPGEDEAFFWTEFKFRRDESLVRVSQHLPLP